MCDGERMSHLHTAEHQPLDVLKGRFSDNEGDRDQLSRMSASFTGALLPAPAALISVQIKR